MLLRELRQGHYVSTQVNRTGSPMALPNDQAQDVSRLSTGIPQLDALLHGGLLTGGLYLTIGTPGSGKTILTNQLAYSYAKGGGQVAYITVLGETYSRLLAHLRQFQFFDPTLVGNRISYISGYGELRNGGLAALEKLISSTVIQERVGLIVLDGIPINVQTPGSPNSSEMNDFVHSLQAVCETAHCTVLRA